MTDKTNDITALRSALFDALEGLRSGSLDLERAKAISDLAQTVINSAKVEVDYLRLKGESARSRFLGPDDDQAAALPPGVRVVTHRLK